jgi:4-nitrophenyl phosphatase
MRSEMLAKLLSGGAGGVDTVLMDLDGTVYHIDHPVPGAIEFLRMLEAEKIRFACLTNSGSSPRRVMERLARMGVNMTEDHIFTAGAAAVDYVMEQFGPRPKVFNLATRGVGEMLQNRVHFVESSHEECDVVIAGDPTSSMAPPDRQQVALELLRNGAGLVGICADRAYPSRRGIEIGGGAFCAMLGFAAGGIDTVFAGKPQPVFFHELCERLRVKPEQCVMVGDNLEGDIGGAKGVGMKAVLVLTGVARQSDIDNVPIDRRPDLVINSVADLLK